MNILSGFLSILIGATLIYIGAIEIVCSLLPKEQGLQVAEWHGHAIGKQIVKIIKKEKPTH
jgi:hypothetical protein